eukprot:scaffold285_cov330-Pavlova_lutheri.AAC.33
MPRSLFVARRWKGWNHGPWCPCQGRSLWPGGGKDGTMGHEVGRAEPWTLDPQRSTSDGLEGGEREKGGSQEGKVHARDKSCGKHHRKSRGKERLAYYARRTLGTSRGANDVSLP